MKKYPPVLFTGLVGMVQVGPKNLCVNNPHVEDLYNFYSRFAKNHGFLSPFHKFRSIHICLAVH